MFMAADFLMSQEFLSVRGVDFFRIAADVNEGLHKLTYFF
jgi:hypothetical protein